MRSDRASNMAGSKGASIRGGIESRKTIRLVVVDDHELLRSGIRFALLPAGDIELVGEARTGEEALRLCATAQPDVVLMDMQLAGDMDGVATTKAIHTLHPTVQVLVLSTYSHADQVQAVLRAGAIGYLIKDVSAKVVADAIRAAHAGHPTLAAAALEALVQPPPVPQPQSTGRLTPREHEVLLLLAQGKSNAQIAECLVVSVAAAKYHVGSILSKLGVANRTEAVARAQELGLIGGAPR